MNARTWSPYQNGIFDFVVRGQGNAVVIAVAGSGKSTTGVQCIRLVERTCSTIFLAFNKSIAEELKTKGVNGRTFHSLTYTPVLRSRGANSITANKLFKLVQANFTGEEVAMYSSFIMKLVGMARQVGIGCLIPNVDKYWISLIETHDLELDSDEADLQTAIDMAKALLDLSNNSDMIDFDDLLYLSVKDGISLPKFDFIMVDEAQDTNAIQRAILRKIMKENSRIIGVGDPAQSIYGFRGADSNAMNLFAREFNCCQLPLTVSYRCPTKVIDEAHKFVKDIEAAPGASEGLVECLKEWTPQIFKPNDLICCRTTKPLIALGYKLIKARIPAYIMGKEIGAGLTNLIDKMKAKGIDNLQLKLHAWLERESEKAIASENLNKIEAMTDKVDAIESIIEGLAESQERTIPKLISIINQLFSPSVESVVLATIHKAKGLEADTVYWLNASQCPSKWAKQDWQRQQERNLCYVVITRAKKSLYMIEEGV